MSKCLVCGYEIKDYSEQILYDSYGCARAKISKGLGTSIESCSNSTGFNRFVAPGENPNKIEEDPDAFKNGFIDMIDANKALQERKLQEFKNKANGRKV